MRLTVRAVIFIVVPIFAISGQAFKANAQNQPPAWVTEGPYTDADSLALELPLEVIGTKLYVEIEIAGKPRRFVFDTGSPSMLSEALADELGLKVVGRNKGVDSHGAVIESKIVQADFTLGGEQFYKVPMFVADFSSAPALQCLIGDGVLGSEILPLCAWQIDLPDQILRCKSNVKELDHVKRADKVALFDFGYPHAPFFDVGLAKDATTKAMFDTGSSAYFAISPPDYEGSKRVGGVSGTSSGYGSLGRSLGGQAPNGNQLQVELKSLSIDRLNLGTVKAHLRELAPSLIGASILEHFVVTLDSRANAAYFQPYQKGLFDRSGFGFSLSYEDGISVSLIWEDSPAANAGLKVGQQMTAINGEPVAATCDGIKHAIRAMSGDSIELEWDDKVIRLTRESQH